MTLAGYSAGMTLQAVPPSSLRTAVLISLRFGRRASKSLLGTSTNFLFDGGSAVQEVTGGTNTANSLTGGVDEVFQRSDSAGSRSFLTEPFGSTLALTDSSGTVQTSYIFDPFGGTTTSGTSSTNTFAYTGSEPDAGNLNLYFYRARYYNATLQRFISEDPIGELAGPNLYRYAGQSPTNVFDPTGLKLVAVGDTGSVALALDYPSLLRSDLRPPQLQFRRFANLTNPVLAHRCSRVLLELRALSCSGMVPFATLWPVTDN